MNKLLLMLCIPLGLYAMENLPDANQEKDQIVRVAHEMAVLKEEGFKAEVSEWLKCDKIIAPTIFQFEQVRNLCIKRYKAPLLELLLEKKIIDPDMQYENYSLLGEAAHHSALENMQALLKYKAKPNILSCNYAEISRAPIAKMFPSPAVSPLLIAIEKKNPALVEMLCRFGADPNENYENSGRTALPLTKAIMDYDAADKEEAPRVLTIIQLLLQYKADPDKEDWGPYCEHNFWYLAPRNKAEKYPEIIKLLGAVKKSP